MPVKKRCAASSAANVRAAAGRALGGPARSCGTRYLRRRSGVTTGAAPALTVATCSALKVVSFRNMTEHPEQAKNEVR
jgi:hypothetical protein